MLAHYGEQLLARLPSWPRLKGGPEHQAGNQAHARRPPGIDLKKPRSMDSGWPTILLRDLKLPARGGVHEGLREDHQARRGRRSLSASVRAVFRGSPLPEAHLR